MDCRICQSPIKRKGKARLCEGCGVICHATCAASVDGSSICDLRAALAAFPSPLSPIATGSPAMDVPADGASTPSLALSPMSHRGQPMTPVASPASPLAFKNPFRSRKPTSEDVAAVEERKENVNPTSPSAFRKAHTARSLSTSAVPSKQQSSMEAVPKRRTRLSKADHSGECLIS